MKARVKATGEIVEINESSTIYDARMCQVYNASELENVSDIDTDYWTRLEHQYAGMAMQGIIANYGVEPLPDDAAHDAYNYAHALVEMIKEAFKMECK